MSKVELIFPEPIVFSEEFVLRNTDLSQAGHLGFDNLVSIIHQVLNHFFDHCGLPISDGRGVSYIVKDLAVVYQGEAHAGDVVSVSVGLGEGGEKWVELYFQALRAEAGQKGAERPFSQANLAIAKLAVLCFDYDKSATVAFPPEVRKALNNAKN